jgi:septal ring factor EnvC (AmiA/AmiB activator)
MKSIIPLFVLSLFLSPVLLRAESAGVSPAEAKLRDNLRNTMLQLRTAQTETANLQAAQAELEKEKTDLKAQLADLNGKFDAFRKEKLAEKEAADKALTDSKAKIAGQETELARLNEAIEKWKKGYAEVLAVAKGKEAERAKLAGELILLQRRVDDREIKNIALFKVGNEILNRYENFGLGDALAAKEPFVGSTRVKMEKLVQDYKDKLLDQKIKPDEAVILSSQK